MLVITRMHTAKRFVSSLMVAAIFFQLVPMQVLAIGVGNTGTTDSGVVALSRGVARPATGASVTTERPVRTLPVHLDKPSTKRSDEQTYTPGEILVKFAPNAVDLMTDAGRATASAFAGTHRLVIAEMITSSNTLIARVEEGTERAVASALNRLPDVLWAQPNYQHAPLTNDTNYALLWALENTGQIVNSTASTTPDHDIDAPEAWTKNEGDDVMVAVIDSGVAFNHPDLLARMWDGSSCVNENGAAITGGCQHGYDFEDEDANPLPTSSDHGTHVAGTIAATGGNNLGTIGVAPKAKVMALKTALTTAELQRAIAFAERNGATIINASYGGPAEDLLEKEALEKFDGVIVAAAGNEGADHADTPSYPCDYDLANIVCVAATDQGDGLAGFSDYGAGSVDVGAPGTNILSTVPTSTTLFSEDFDEVTTPALPSTFTSVSTTDWGTFGTETQKVLYGDAVHFPYEDAVIANTAVESSVVDLSGTSNATLSFHTWCDTEYGAAFVNADAMFLYFGTTDAGFESVDVWNEFTIDDDVDDSNIAPLNTRTISIPDGLRTSAFRFRFSWFTNGNGDTGTNGEGCFVDDVVLTTLDDGTSEQYAFKDGTSMAAPHVSGVAALVKGYNTNIAVSKLKEIILNTGDALASLAGKTVSGKRVNAAHALNVFSPRVGRAADDVVELQERPLGEHSQKISFSVRDGIAGLPLTLKQFEYSVDGGATWQAPTNGDASLAISAAQSPGDWRDHDYVSVTEFPDVATETIILNVAHADLVELVGADTNDVRIHFKANDGAVDSPFAVSAAFAVDLLAPTAVLSNTPAALTNATNALITIGGDDVVSYGYALDGDAFTVTAFPVAEPLVLSGLVEGVHTLRVIAKDDEENEQASTAATTFTWTIDTTPGTALLMSKPAARTNATGATFVIGGEDVAAYTYQLDGGETSDPFNVSESIVFVGLAEGSHTLAVTGIDALGNTQVQPTAYTWTIDTTPPSSSGGGGGSGGSGSSGGGGGGGGSASAASLSISGVPSDPTSTATATLTIGGTDVVAYRFALDGDAFGTEVPVATPITLTNLADGAHTVRVIGRDEVGNFQTEVNATTVSWTVDTVAPTLAETTPVATPTNDTTPGLIIQIENSAAWQVLRGETVLASGTGTGTTQTTTLAALTDGIYTLTLVATDAAGNRASITLEAFVIDTTSPVGISLVGVPAALTNVTSATITIAVGSDIVAYRFALDGGAFGDETPVATPITLTGLADGAHTLRIIGKDAAGNLMPESIAATATWTVDTVPPTATLEHLPRTTTPATVANITVGGAGVVAYRSALDGGAFGDEQPIAEPIALRNLANGTHTIAVIGRDAAGNLQDAASAATFSWLVDRSLAVPPTANPASGVLATPKPIRFSAPLADNLHYAFENPEMLSCTTGSSIGIDGELLVDRATTIHVVACYAGGVPSEVQSFTYTFVASGGGGGGGGGGPSFIFSSPASARAVESSAPVIATTPAVLGGQVLGVREFASGTLLRVDERDLFLLEGNILHRIPNPKALWRYRNRERIQVTQADVAGYTMGVSVLDLRTSAAVVNDVRTIASGTLLRVDGGDIFLVQGTTLRRIPNLETLWRYRDRRRIEVSAQALGRFQVGIPLQ